MTADPQGIHERYLLLERCFSPIRLYEIGVSLGLPYFKEFRSGWKMEKHRAIYNLAVSVSEDQLKEVFSLFSPWKWARFRGGRYTFENGRLSIKGAWEPVRFSVKAFLKRYGKSGKATLDILAHFPSGVSVYDLKQKLPARLRRTDLRPLIEELSSEGLIFIAYRSERYIEWKIPDELVPPVRAELLGEPPVYHESTPGLNTTTEKADDTPHDYLVAERRRIERMDQEFDSYLNDLLKNRLEETVKFGKDFSVTALAEYLNNLFGPVLYFDSLLSISQQYGLADIQVRSEAKHGSIGLKTGFNLALFGEPGTGKSYSTRDIILGQSDGSVPPHGLPGRNRYAAGMTPARFIRIGQVYTGLSRNFIVPEFNDWFRSEGMVEILKLAMERGEIRSEMHREVIGPYRFNSFFSVNYNTHVSGRVYKTTVSDPNFQAIEDRMICRLHRLTKQRYEEIAQSRLRMFLGETDFGGTSRRIRDHLTLVHAIETRHPLVKDQFPEKPPLITKTMLKVVQMTREAILTHLPNAGVPFSARLEDRSIRLASALSLMEYFHERGDFIPVGKDAQMYAVRFYVEEAGARSGVNLDPDEVLAGVTL